MRLLFVTLLQAGRVAMFLSDDDAAVDRLVLACQQKIVTEFTPRTLVPYFASEAEYEAPVVRRKQAAIITR